MLIKITQLPSIRTISFHSLNSNFPEKEAHTMLTRFMKENSLLNNPAEYQVYGRNNPVSLNNPGKRGYEFLLTIPENFPPGNFKEAVLTEQLYAVFSCRGIKIMQECWQKLIEWIKNSSIYTFGYPQDYDYEYAPSLELEHHIDPLNGDENTMIIDYYFPVRRKT